MGTNTTIDPARLHRALNPRSIAVVGDKGPGYMWLTNQSEFTGDLYSVQLAEKGIAVIRGKGVQNFPSPLALPAAVHLRGSCRPRRHGLRSSCSFWPRLLPHRPQRTAPTRWPP